MNNVFRRFWGLAMLMSCIQPGVSAFNLDNYLWRNRLLVLVAPEHTDPSVEQVLETLAHNSPALSERHLLVIQLFGHGPGQVDGRHITATQAVQLRETLAVGLHDKVIILIGKDGGIKRRAPLLTDLEDIFTQIDAMPMRREEMRRGRTAAP